MNHRFLYFLVLLGRLCCVVCVCCVLLHTETADLLPGFPSLWQVGSLIVAACLGTLVQSVRAFRIDNIVVHLRGSFLECNPGIHILGIHSFCLSVVCFLRDFPLCLSLGFLDNLHLLLHSSPLVVGRLFGIGWGSSWPGNMLNWFGRRVGSTAGRDGFAFAVPYLALPSGWVVVS